MVYNAFSYQAFTARLKPPRCRDLDAQVRVAGAVLQDFSSVTELVSASLRPGLLLEHHDSGFVQVERQSPFLPVLFQQGQAVLETLGRTRSSAYSRHWTSESCRARPGMLPERSRASGTRGVAAEIFLDHPQYTSF